MKITETKKEFEKIVYGIDIDNTENGNGWWDTSTGVEHGLGVKNKLWVWIQNKLQEAKTTRTRELEYKLRKILNKKQYKIKNNLFDYPTKQAYNRAMNDISKELTVLVESLNQNDK